MKPFLQKLQKAPRKRKDKWIILLTAVAMIAVLFLWLTYFNALLEISTAQSQPEEPQHSFFTTMQNGARVVWSTIMGSFDTIGGWLFGSREIQVRP